MFGARQKHIDAGLVFFFLCLGELEYIICFFFFQPFVKMLLVLFWKGLQKKDFESMFWGVWVLVQIVWCIVAAVLSPVRIASSKTFHYDAFMVPDGLFAMARKLWRIPVLRPGHWRRMLNDSTCATLLQDFEVDSTYHAAVLWVQKHLHKIRWLPNVHETYVHFPMLPAQPERQRSACVLDV